MGKLLLSVNAGSSSVKVSVYSVEKNSSLKQLAETSIDGLTEESPQLMYKRGSEMVATKRELEQPMKSQDNAFRFLLDQLLNDENLTEVSKKEDMIYACHRVAHGGDYTESKLIDQATYEYIAALTNLAPLHNSPSLQIVKTCMNVLPETKNIAYFDTLFHQSMPEHIRTYPINPQIAKRNKLRKYGFHGISFKCITYAVAKFLQKEESATSIIALHLGSGASACAIKNGKSWDTSMGLTPVAGLPGATRSGSVDPSLVFHYASNVGKLSPSSTGKIHVSEAEEILNKEAGWKALTGTANFGEIVASSDPNMKLAFDIFVDRVCGYVGSYYVSLEGQVDALVFAGGIGVRSEELRRRVVEKSACLGFQVDVELNAKKIESVVQDVGSRTAKHRTLICQSDEQVQMARSFVADKRFFL